MFYLRADSISQFVAHKLDDEYENYSPQQRVFGGFLIASLQTLRLFFSFFCFSPAAEASHIKSQRIFAAQRC